MMLQLVAIQVLLARRPRPAAAAPVPVPAPAPAPPLVSAAPQLHAAGLATPT